MAYHPKTLQCLAMLQIVVGGISMLLGIASAVLETDFTSYVGFGIWIGVWILVTGLLGFFGSRDHRVTNKCLLGTFMGFAITACVLCGVMLICYSIALAGLSSKLRCYERNDRNYDSNYYYSSRYYNSYYYRDYCGRVSYSRAKAGVGIGSVMLIIAILEFFVALTSSIYCCNAVCSSGPSQVQATPQVVYLQPGQMQPGGMVFMTSAGAAPGTVMQAPSGQFVMQQPGQPAFMAVSQPGVVPVSTAVQPAGYMAATGGQGQVQQQAQYKGPDAPPAYNTPQ